jgi:hypothetical protein
MFSAKQITILIIAGVLLLLLGAGVGALLSRASLQQTKVNAVNSLASRVISSIVAYGQVKNINGRNITLSNLGDDLTITVADSAQIYSFVTPSTTDKNKTATTAPVQQTVGFGNVKVGDNINMTIRLLPTGQLEGASVIILPATK